MMERTELERIAMGIVNRVNENVGTSVPVRQSTNDVNTDEVLEKLKAIHIHADIQSQLSTLQEKYSKAVESIRNYLDWNGQPCANDICADIVHDEMEAILKGAKDEKRHATKRSIGQDHNYKGSRQNE